MMQHQIVFTVTDGKTNSITPDMIAVALGETMENRLEIEDYDVKVLELSPDGTEYRLSRPFPPEEIYLQVDFEGDEITWCVDRIHDTDIPYVLKYPDGEPKVEEEQEE